MATKKVLRLGAGEALGVIIATGDVTEAWAYQTEFNAATRMQKTREGVPVWRIGLIALGFGELEVSVPAAQRPSIASQARVVLPGLVAGSTAKGFWFAADSIEVTGGAA